MGSFPAILAGLMVSLGTGASVLGILVVPDLALSDLRWEFFAAGLLTFPVGTGLYYACGHAFGRRMEVASQFANVKPLFSVLFALLFLDELLNAGSAWALGFILLGIGVLIWGSIKREFSWKALILGLLLACTWAAGEAFIKIGLEDEASSLTATFVALASGTLVGIVFSAPYIFRRRTLLPSGIRWMLPFLGHGLLSFALAYGALFESIDRIGVIDTVLITAFWPALAVALAQFSGGAVSQQRSPRIYYSMLLLAAGSLFYLGVLARGV
jgi:drug/metabolite transporter (DMT)-like permease